MIWIANRVDALQLRLFAACLVFWIAGALLDSVWLIQLMGACAFAALAVIPLRFVMAITDSLTGGRFLGT